MQTLKGGWFSQTFALAKSNDPGNKKARIRRSKEERKAMVESFIKKHQKLNNGSFPSLNLTHKEVGGSFYTIREIVRDIIQENKVLGPAKLTPDEENTDQLLEQSPLGLISMESPIPSSILSSGIPLAPNNQGSEVKIVPNVDGAFDEHRILDNEHVNDENQIDAGNEESDMNHATSSCFSFTEHQRLDRRQLINGSNVDTENEESDGTTERELKANAPSEQLETVKGAVPTFAGATPSTENKDKASTKLPNMLENVFVETFPMQPITTVTERPNGQSGELGNVEESLVGPVKETEALECGDPGIQPENLTGISPLGSDLVDLQIAEYNDDPLSDKASELLEKEATHFVSLSPSEASEQWTTKNTMAQDREVGGDNKIAECKDGIGVSVAVRQIQLSADMQPRGAQIHNPAEATDGASSNHERTSTIKETEAANDRVGAHNSARVQGSNTTLNRIKPESWKAGRSQETNPLLAILKSFAAAFVKFWSE